MKVLVINAGSSSLKYQLIEMDTHAVLCSGLVERVKEPMGRLRHKIAPDTDKEDVVVIEQEFPNHTAAMKSVVALLTDAQKGVIKDKSEIGAIGHRVVHGGEAITAPMLVNQQVKDAILANVPLSPLHNPANLMGIEVAEELFPGTPNVAVFDTEFATTLTPDAFLYPLPYNLYTDLKVRRYGFHGTSHKYVSRKAAEFIGKPLSEFNGVIMHLGNGSSMTAIRNGKCIDTTMGLTPLEGLMMGTRCGSIDPSIVPYVMDKTGMSLSDIDTLMNKKSGLFGICGYSDMRDIHAACDRGEEKAKLALDMFVRTIKKFLGAYIAILGHVDAIVFTAGIGENDDIARSMICNNMDAFGIAINEEANKIRSSEPRSISLPGSKVQVLIVPTNEELEIAMTTANLINK